MKLIKIIFKKFTYYVIETFSSIVFDTLVTHHDNNLKLSHTH